MSLEPISMYIFRLNMAFFKIGDKVIQDQLKDEIKKLDFRCLHDYLTKKSIYILKYNEVIFFFIRNNLKKCIQVAIMRKQIALI